MGTRPVVFDVNRASVSPRDLQWIVDTLKPSLSKAPKGTRILARTSASPEGTLQRNHQLARSRRDAVLKVLNGLGIQTAHMAFDVVDEDYEMLQVMMHHRLDPDRVTVDSLIHFYGTDTEVLKEKLRKQDGGRLWDRLLHTYFSELRAVRFSIIPPEPEPKPEPAPAPAVKEEPLPQPEVVQPAPVVVPEPLPVVADTLVPREPMLSVKTNLLYTGAWIPHLGFRPIWNVEAEYYFHDSKYSIVGEYEFPWWRRDARHEYFQIQNWTGELRRYFNKEARGHYLSLYGQYAYWDYAYSDVRGWQGEGFGGGLGYGYVIRFGKQSRWKLELLLKLGFYTCKYDPYDAGDPYQGKYYYEWDDDPSKFIRRNYRFNWFGPTSLGVTLSYDLLYRRASDGHVTWKKLFKSR